MTNPTQPRTPRGRQKPLPRAKNQEWDRDLNLTRKLTPRATGFATCFGAPFRAHSSASGLLCSTFSLGIEQCSVVALNPAHPRPSVPFRVARRKGRQRLCTRASDPGRCVASTTSEQEPAMPATSNPSARA
jgi:hypothetical protein